ncbi:hypothetical protein F0562_022606 [Nyssa sinensis]|uniref:Uncharacterized protein n=1 Tax=Nyssa sinensis TaxID=561372 RepID=A0A5J5BPN0_9ASTE|nr:hypothetical protein F0562_022606 [Nyssa sinensis]
MILRLDVSPVEEGRFQIWFDKVPWAPLVVELDFEAEVPAAKSVHWVKIEQIRFADPVISVFGGVKDGELEGVLELVVEDEDGQVLRSAILISVLLSLSVMFSGKNRGNRGNCRQQLQQGNGGVRSGQQNQQVG